MPVSPVATVPATVPASATGLTAKDVSTARGLKAAINKQLMTARPSQTPDAKRPTLTNGVWKAPNGDRLFRVSLSTTPPGAADFGNKYALVDPKTNQYYAVSSGGLSGRTFFAGPAKLPTAAQFKRQPYNVTEMKGLEKTANAPAAAPTKAQVTAAYHQHQAELRFARRPAFDAKDILKEYSLTTGPSHPDKMGFTAVVLKHDPSQVWVHRTGGIAGFNDWAGPIDVK